MTFGPLLFCTPGLHASPRILTGLESGCFIHAMETDQLLELIAAHKWVPLAAAVIVFTVRLQKAGKLPGLSRIPSNYRPFLALALGVTSGILNRIVEGTRWQTALLDGVLSALIAIASHDTVIEGLRGGLEIGGGGAKKPDPTAPPAGGPDVLAKSELTAAQRDTTTRLSQFPLVVGAGILAVLALASIQACGYGAVACKIIDVAENNCVWLRYLETDGTKQEVQLSPTELREFGRAMKTRRAIEAKANAEFAADLAGKDGGK